MKRVKARLQKGGEGSRGGRVVGHTKSGHPIYESIGKLKTGESHHFGNFSVKKKGHESYVLMDKRDKSRSRWGNKSEISADALHAHKTDSLPAKGSEPKSDYWEKSISMMNDSIDKAVGEGSRGGKIIGHTRSGKPIYENAMHSGHAKFSQADHDDAHNLHRSKASELTFRDSMRGQQEHHEKQASIHALESIAKKPVVFRKLYSSKSVKPLVISDSNPLSNQLHAHTGSHYGADFTGSARLGDVLTHKKTGQKFTAMNEHEAVHVNRLKRSMVGKKEARK